MVKFRAPWVSRVCAVAVAAVLCSQLSTSAAEEGPYPGLQQIEPTNGGWAGVAQTGMAETARAKQWVRVPVSVATSWTYVRGTVFPGGDVQSRNGLANAVIFVSEAGADDNYGHMPPMKVRTVAFGAIPVEATVQVSQRRDADGYAIPIRFEAMNDKLTDETYYLHDTVLEDKVRVRITSLKIDHVDVDLVGNCSVEDDAHLYLRGKGYSSVDPTAENAVRDWTVYFNPPLGGRLNGTLDLPPFSGCTTTTGDDLSRILTASVSGSDNALVFQLGTANCLNRVGPLSYPPAPGESTPELARCQQVPKDVDYPSR